MIVWVVGWGRAHAKSQETLRDPEQVLVEIQRQIIELDREFESIRKDLFFPEEDEVLFYLRSQLQETIPFQALEILVNGKTVSRHTYTDAEKVAFHFSGLQPLYRFSLKPGQYQVTARFALPPERPASGATFKEHRFSFQKSNAPRFVEIEVSQDRKSKMLSFANRIY